MAEKFLSDAGVPFEKVYADVNAEAAKKYDIKQAPTLIVENENGFEKIMNVSNIRRFTETFRK